MSVCDVYLIPVVSMVALYQKLITGHLAGSECEKCKIYSLRVSPIQKDCGRIAKSQLFRAKKRDFEATRPARSSLQSPSTAAIRHGFG